VATVSVANQVVSVLLGALVLQERLDKSPPWHAVVAVGALCLALLGAVLISSAREQPNEAGRKFRKQGRRPLSRRSAKGAAAHFVPRMVRSG
jgi:NhaP-type Na+/H+ or K+/H+ antiporter